MFICIFLYTFSGVLERVKTSDKTALRRHSLESWAHGAVINKQQSFIYAPVAQLDRVSPSEGEGRGFESRLVRHFSFKINSLSFLS